MTSAARLRPHLRRRCSTRNHAGKVSLGWSLGAARDDAEAARAPPPDARVGLFVADIDETASWLSTLSGLSEDSAPSPSLDFPTAQAAPTQSGAPPEHLASRPCVAPGARFRPPQS